MDVVVIDPAELTLDPPPARTGDGRPPGAASSLWPGAGHLAANADDLELDALEPADTDEGG